MSADIIDLRPGSRVGPPTGGGNNGDAADDLVLELYGRWVKARRELRTVEADCEAAAKGPECAEAESACAGANKTLHGIECAMAEAIATSVAGVVAKLRVAAFEVIRSKSEEGRQIEDNLLLSAVADIMGRPNLNALG